MQVKYLNMSLFMKTKFLSTTFTGGVASGHLYEEKRLGNFHKLKLYRM